MELKPDFAFHPTTPVHAGPLGPPEPGADLGLLQGLAGPWNGAGFNTIWRPDQPALGSDHFLEINVTTESLEFDEIPGDIPNRGLLQGDLFMHGFRYLQQISDAKVNGPDDKPAGLHIEPGLWLNIPSTADPAEPPTVARLGSIPHGTTIVMQGLASTSNGAPVIPPVSITPFVIGNPASLIPFPEQQLGSTSQFRTPNIQGFGVDQEMLDDPNTVLRWAVAGQNIVSTITLQVSSDASAPILGGGTANTAFLQGGPDGPNADAARVDATFWLQTVEGQPEPQLLQYSQTVLLNFRGLSWPHVTVATLTQKPGQ